MGGCSRGRPGRIAALSFGGALAIATAGVIAVSSNSCTTTNTVLVAPPEIAGAEFVGTSECSTCHADIVDHFSSATHSALMAEGENAKTVGCESCHGPGSKHIEGGGDRAAIVNPGRSPDACFRCHLDKRGDFALPYTHPVTGGPLALVPGRVTCSDCHELHEGPAVVSGGTQAPSENETCLRCHIAQRGPFVFEHEALREGCTVCHAPHGSVNQKMLTERDGSLCLKCHFQQQTSPTQILIGGRDHSSLLARGTCFSAGCHEAVHGSQVNSSLRF